MTTKRKIICPKCGAENLAWRSRCVQCGEELHKDEGKIPKFSSDGAIWLPYLLGLLGTGILFSVLSFGVSLGEHSYVFILMAAPLLGLSIGWKWPLAGGILLGIASLSVMIWMTIEGAWLVLTIGIFLLLLASGIFLILTNRDR